MDQLITATSSILGNLPELTTDLMNGDNDDDFDQDTALLDDDDANSTDLGSILGLMGAAGLDAFNGTTNGSTNLAGNRTMRPRRRTLGLEYQIPIYALIFLLSVVGNILVIITVIQNKKMRSVTNAFLLNLAFSDLLLSVFCMPFTLIPMFLQNFIFGKFMCVAIRYLQGVSVAASCFTLVAISLERYFAICHPLKSRRWQTLSHSYKAIALCWVLALSIMMPTAIYHELIPLRGNRHRCVERFPNIDGSRGYSMTLIILLMAFPVLIMTWAYGCVSYTLWLGMRIEKESEKDKQTKEGGVNYNAGNGVSIFVNSKKINAANDDHSPSSHVNGGAHSGGSAPGGGFVAKSSFGGHATGSVTSASRPFRRIDAHRAMRQSNSEKSRAAKKRVIKMLFVIVLEFFIFWTPTYVLDTWMAFDYGHANATFSPMTKSLIHLLSYISACCNPITYCFMNKNFRHSFLSVFKCMKKRYVYANRSQMSFTGNTASTRAPLSQATTYDKIDSDDISENSF